MKKSVLSVILCVSMVLSFFSIVTTPALAAATAAFTVSDVFGAVGETATVNVDLTTADAYLVNGNFVLTYDPAYLELVGASSDAEGCFTAGSLVASDYYAGNGGTVGRFEFAFAMNAEDAITTTGTLFTLQFKVLSDAAASTAIALNVTALGGSTDGGVTDYDVASTVSGGLFIIVGGSSNAACNDIPMLDATKLDTTSNATLTEQADGSFYIEATAAGSVVLQGPGTYNAATYQWTHIAITSDVPFYLSFYDAANNKQMTSKGDFFPQFHCQADQPAPAGSYVLALHTKGCYTWDGSPLPATVQISSIRIEPQAAGKLVVSHLALSDNASCSLSAPVIPNAPVTRPSASPEKGDVNSDGSITLADAMQAFYHVNEKATLEGNALKAADLDDDGIISLGEAMKIFYFVNEKIDSLV